MRRAISCWLVDAWSSACWVRWRSRDAVRQRGHRVVQREVLHLRRLLRGAMHRGHRQRQHGDEVEPVLRDHRHRRAEREQGGVRPAAEQQVAEQVVADSGLLEQRLRGAGEDRVHHEEDDRADRDRGQVAGLETLRPAEARAAEGLEHRARRDPRERELGDVEEDAVERAAPDQVRDQRGRHLHRDDLRQAVHEQDRERERSGEGLLPLLAVHLDREQLADEDERGEHPELGVERTDVARPDDGERHQRDGTRGRYQSQVEGEGLKLARHWSEWRRIPDRSSAWAKRTPLFRAAQCGRNL